jgi:hypothetical protein
LDPGFVVLVLCLVKYVKVHLEGVDHKVEAPGLEQEEWQDHLSQDGLVLAVQELCDDDNRGDLEKVKLLLVLN